ncbi:MAG TPA: tetratricopeptide repeat protein [Thermoanaerobaculia bacterium]|nr:tetratricopeptide repeat protein [Thermoanaerobaculia bacterium]
MKRMSCLTVLGVLALAARLLAVGQGRVVGVVSDSSGNPIEGVTLTVTTPSMKSLKISVKTDKTGHYAFIVNDATLRYHMRFEKEGYAPADRDEKFSISEPTTISQKLMKASEAPAARGAAPAPAAPSANDQSTKAYNEGVDLLNAGDKDGAAKRFEEAVAKNPDFVQGWQALTTIAYQKKDWAKTLEYGQKATDLDPSQTSMYAMLADAAEKSGDKKAAAQWQGKYAEANPDSPEILYNKGIDAYNKKNLKDAETYLTKATEAKPDFALAHFWLGMTSFTLNKKPAAKEHLEKYLQLDPNGSEAATAKELLPLLK